MTPPENGPALRFGEAFLANPHPTCDRPRREQPVAFISVAGRYGLGRVAARVSAAEGAQVFGCARHKETLAMARAEGGVSAMGG